MSVLPIIHAQVQFPLSVATRTSRDSSALGKEAGRQCDEVKQADCFVPSMRSSEISDWVAQGLESLDGEQEMAIVARIGYVGMYY